MKTAPLLSCSRTLIGLAVAGAALLSAGGASAQTASPFYAFTGQQPDQVKRRPRFSVYDSVNFNDLQINETFADSFSQSFALPVLGAGDTGASPLQSFVPGLGFTDPAHGALTSATLTGTLSFPGLVSDGSGKLSLTLQPTADPNSQ